jgi:tRNA A37 threonylcarbamoyladenosine biosynthesis protein TsaE
LIEWASKYPQLLPVDHLHVQLVHHDTAEQRVAIVQAIGDTNDILLDWKEKWMKHSESF